MRPKKNGILNRHYEVHAGQRHYEEISFLRGFSILTIVLMHLIQGYLTSCSEFVRTASSIGGAGVHVFFFCSGFGLYLSQMREPKGFFKFFNRRFWKIYVPYIVVITVSVHFPFLYSGNRIKAFLSHVLLYKMFFPEYEDSFGMQFWYVSTLFQFYLLFIPLCRVKERLGRAGFLAFSFMTSLFWWIFLAVTGLHEERIWGSFCLQYLWEFALGMFLADWLECGGAVCLNVFQLASISAAGLGLMAAAALKGGVLKTFNDVPALAGYGALSLLVYYLGTAWMKNLVLAVSKISYELYLVHILIFSLTFTVTGAYGKSELVVGSVSLFIAAAAAYLYHGCCSKIAGNIEKNK